MSGGIEAWGGGGDRRDGIGEFESSKYLVDPLKAFRFWLFTCKFLTNRIYVLLPYTKSFSEILEIVETYNEITIISIQTRETVENHSQQILNQNQESVPIQQIEQTMTGKLLFTYHMRQWE